MAPAHGTVARMYFESIQQMKKHLGQLDKWLDTAGALAESKKFDAKNFMGLRLAVDQFPFSRQVQIVCDTAKTTAARLGGKEAPSHPDTEQTLAELSARIKTVIAFLDTFTAADFDSAASRSITQPRWEGKTMTGANYFLEHAQPNFYFHLTTAYAILRQNGVGVGKRDYLGALTQKAP